MADITALRAGDFLVREGDPSDALFIVKKGRFAVLKAKGNQEIELAEIKPGQLIGEMAFFDQKPRSASIKALTECEVIELPFKNLQAQFDGSPDWLKAMVRTITENLREANKRIKQLEQSQVGLSYKESGAGKKGLGLSPYQANKLCAILSLVTRSFGTRLADGQMDVKPGILRRYTIQVFQESTARMQSVMNVLAALGYLRQEDLGEGKMKLTVFRSDVLEGFVEWLTDYLFAEQAKRITLGQDHLKVMRAVIHFGRKGTADEKGLTKISLVQMQNESMKELGHLVGVNDVNPLIEKHLAGEKFTEADGTFVKVDVAELGRIEPFWTLFYAFELEPV